MRILFEWVIFLTLIVVIEMGDAGIWGGQTGLHTHIGLAIVMFGGLYYAVQRSHDED